MARLTRRVTVVLLVLAALVGACAALLSVFMVRYSVDELSGEGVVVRYVSVNPAVPPYLVRLPRPTLVVVDEGGKHIAGVSVSLYAGLPGARAAFLGRLSGRGGVVVLRQGLAAGLRERVMPAWRSVLGGVEGFKAGVLAFIDVLTPAGGGRFEVYSFVKTIPVNLGLLSRGYSIASIKVTVNTAVVKPAEVLNLSGVKAVEGGLTGGHALSAGEGSGGCIPLRADGVYAYYCVAWRLEKTYAHIENKVVPIVAVRVPRKYYTAPQAVSTIFESFAFKDTGVSWFRVYAAAKIAGDPHVELMEWESYTKLDFLYSKAFYNSRWLSDRPSFRDDAIVAIGLKASAALDEFRKYEAVCGRSPCSDSGYRPTGVTANITLIDIPAKYSRGRWVSTGYGYVIDDSLGDGRGMERFWKLMTAHSEVVDSGGGAGEARYQFQSYKERDVDMGVDVVDLLSALAGIDAGKLAKYFPVSAGFGWGDGEKSSNVVEIYVKNYYVYSNYYVFLTNYVCRYKAFLGDDGVQLKLMYFDADIYPPSRV